MTQHLIIGLAFLAAIVFLARLVYRQFKSKPGCATGCHKCGAVDFQKIEQQIKSGAGSK